MRRLYTAKNGYLKLAPISFEPGTPPGKIRYADDGGAYEKNDGQKIYVHIETPLKVIVRRRYLTS